MATKRNSLPNLDNAKLAAAIRHLVDLAVLAERGDLDEKSTTRLVTMIDGIEKDAARSLKSREGSTQRDLADAIAEVYTGVVAGSIKTPAEQLDALREVTGYVTTLPEQQLRLLVTKPEKLRPPKKSIKGEKNIRAGAKNAAVEAVAGLYGPAGRTIYNRARRSKSAPRWPRSWERVEYVLRVHGLSARESRSHARELFDPDAVFDE